MPGMAEEIRVPNLRILRGIYQRPQNQDTKESEKRKIPVTANSLI
jgi:hypothetical protein